MVQKKNAKLTALGIVAVTSLPLILSVCPADYGLTADASLHARLTYPMVHAGFCHWTLNAWSLLGVVFGYTIGMPELILAFCIAVSVPGSVLTHTPVVGMSGFVYALMGMAFLKSRAKTVFAAYLAAYTAFGFCFANVAALLHLYCLGAGLTAGLGLVWIRRLRK